MGSSEERRLAYLRNVKSTPWSSPPMCWAPPGHRCHLAWRVGDLQDLAVHLAHVGRGLLSIKFFLFPPLSQRVWDFKECSKVLG